MAFTWELNIGSIRWMPEGEKLVNFSNLMGGSLRCGPLLLICVAVLSSWSQDAAAQGAGTADAATRYFQQFESANGTLRTAAMNFGRQWRPVLEGKEPNAEGVNKALADVQTAYGQVATQMKQAVPPNSPEGVALRVAHQAFLQAQAKIVQEEFPKMASIAVNRQQSLSQRKVALEQLLSGVGAIEQKTLPALVAAVTAYAKKYNIQLGPPTK